MISTATHYRCTCGLEHGHAGACIKPEDYPRPQTAMERIADLERRVATIEAAISAGPITSPSA